MEVGWTLADLAGRICSRLQFQAPPSHRMNVMCFGSTLCRVAGNQQDDTATDQDSGTYFALGQLLAKEYATDGRRPENTRLAKCRNSSDSYRVCGPQNHRVRDQRKNTTAG
jgi:hypothetical protein